MCVGVWELVIVRMDFIPQGISHTFYSVSAINTVVHKAQSSFFNYRFHFYQYVYTNKGVCRYML